MTPRLKVSISPSPSKPYPPTQTCPVNSPTPTALRTDNFQGEISVWVKGFEGDGKAGDGHEYFDVRKEMTYGIVVRGRFLDDVNGDDIVFGNVFENSVAKHLPYGTSIATKFMHFIDPTLELDIYADKPWALSPVLATMNHLQIKMSKEPLKYSSTVIEDSLPALSELYGTSGSNHVPSEGSDESSSISSRRKWLTSADNRKSIKLNKDVYVGMEFANGLLDFNTLSAKLPDPFHFSINLLKYWDGQPVTYVCQRKPPPGVSPVGYKVYWSVAFEIVDEEAIKALEAKGLSVRHVTEDQAGSEGKSGSQDDAEKGDVKEDTKISDDVD